MSKIIKLSKGFLEAYSGRELDSAGFKVVYDKLTLILAPPEEDKVIDFSSIDSLLKFPEPPPILAGGSIVRWLLGRGEWQSDFDVWFGSEDSRDKAREKLNRYRTPTETETHSFNYKLPIGKRTVKLQSVSNPFKSCDDLFNDFDLDICSFAYIGGDSIFATDTGFANFLHRKLDIRNMRNEEYTKARIKKYMTMGFLPSREAIQVLMGETIKEDEVEY